MLRLAAITGLMLLGLASALSQESKFAKQAVNFSVRRSDASIVLGEIKHKAVTSELTRAKVTVAFDVPVKRVKDRPVGSVTTHVDADLLRSEELDSAFRKRSFLVTITDCNRFRFCRPKAVPL